MLAVLISKYLTDGMFLVIYILQHPSSVVPMQSTYIDIPLLCQGDEVLAQLSCKLHVIPLDNVAATYFVHNVLPVGCNI